MLHQIPIRSERRRLDLQGVSVEPVAKVLLDGDSVLVDIGTMASRHTRRIAGLLSGQVCKSIGDQAAVGWVLSGVWACWCRSSLSRSSARSVVVNFHLKLRHEVARRE